MRNLLLSMFAFLILTGASFKYGGIKHDITTTAKSGGTTTLTASSSQVQAFTGTSAQTVRLPSGITLSNGYWYTVSNEGSSGAISVQDASTSIIKSVAASSSSTFYMKNSAVIGGNWSVDSGSGSSGDGGGGVEDWATTTGFTPASGAFGTISASHYIFKCEGNTLYGKGKWTNGTVAGGTMSLDLPSGYTIDLTLAPVNTHLGIFSALNASQALFGSNRSGVLFSDGSDDDTIFFAVQVDGAANFNKDVGNAVTTSSGKVSFDIIVPVSSCP